MRCAELSLFMRGLSSMPEMYSAAVLKDF
jgi:hypothetical protein